MTLTSPLGSDSNFTVSPDGYGWYEYTDKNGVYHVVPHAGNDYEVVDKPFYSIADGVVAYASRNQPHAQFGYFVLIQHKDEGGLLIDRFSLYLHLDKPPSVETADTVIQGITQLGISGNGGSATTGPHLHVSILEGLSASQVANISDLQLGFREWDHAIQSGTIRGEALVGDISPTVPLGTAVRDDWFIPMAGTDTIYGGGGADTVEYQESIDRIWWYRADNSTTIALAVSETGAVDADVLYGVERLADDGGKNFIDLSLSPILALIGGPSARASHYVIPLRDYTSVKIDGGGGQDVAVIWGVKSDWTVTDVGGGNTWLTSNSTPPGGRASASAITHTIEIENIEAVEFSDGRTYTIAELLGNEPVGGRSVVDVRVAPGQDPYDEKDSGNWVGYDFIVSMDKVQAEDVTIRWTLRGYGTNGTDSSDFADGLSGIEVIRAGNLSSNLTVYTLGDDVPEFDEDFRLEISIDSTDLNIAQVGQATAYGTIVNDDGFISSDDDFGDSFVDASLLPSYPDAATGLIESPTDKDVFKVYLWEGMSYYFLFASLSGGGAGALPNPEFRILDASGAAVPFVDQYADPYDIYTEIEILESGVYYLTVGSSGSTNTGGYQVGYSATNASFRELDRNVPMVSNIAEPNSVVTVMKHINPSFVTSSSVSFRSDAAVDDLSAFEITVYELNGTLVSGEWVKVGGGVWTFLIESSEQKFFFFRVEALTSSAVGEFTMAALSPGESLPPLPTAITGTADSEAIDGNNIANTISGLDGNDTINGSGGDDSIIAGAGSDSVSGGAGNDKLTGGDGADDLVGDDGNDTASYSDSTVGVVVSLFAGLGSQGTAEGDRLVFVENLEGSTSADSLTGDNGANSLVGGAGKDILVGMGQNDTMSGGTESDALNGGSGNDSLNGGSGNDTMTGGTGSDVLNGGSGIDRAVFTGNANATIDLTVSGPQGTGNGQDRLISIENLTTGGGNDSLTGSNVANSITSGAGNDTVNSGAGNDSIDAGAGNDELNGSSGDDLLDGGAGNDTLVLAGSVNFTVNLTKTVVQTTGEGTDILLNIENVTTGSGADRVTGNSAANILFGKGGVDQLLGGAGNDTISGGGGNDAINGGKGNDALSGGSGTDSFIFQSGFGNDKIIDFSAGPGPGDFLNLSSLGLVLTDLTISSAAGGTATKITVTASGDSILLTTVAFGTFDSSSDLLL